MGERSLWSAVLATALADAVYRGESAPAIDHRDEADRWFRSGGKKFQQVCSLAGYDPQAVQDAYLSGRVSFDPARCRSLKHDNRRRAIDQPSGVV